MTSTVDAPEGVDVDESEGTTTVDESKKRGRNPDRDFTKFVQRHQDLADFINAHEAFQAAGLPEVTPNVVKVVQLLAEDFRNTPEQIAARKQREQERKNEEKEFQGLDPEEIKELKAANRKAKQLAEVQERRQALLDKARQIRESNEASGEDLETASQADSETDSETESGASEPGKRGRGIRNRRAG